jgi:hypothetical protein
MIRSVRPLRKWLDERGVVFEMNTTVTNLVILDASGVKTVDQIVFERGGRSGRIAVRPIDRVFVMLGSMTEGSSLGSMDAAPLVKSKGGRNSGSPASSPTMSTSRNGSPSPRRGVFPRFCASSAISPATFQAKAA